MTDKEPTALVTIGGRQIAMRAPGEGAVLVMARITRGIPASGADAEKLTDAQRAKIMRSIGSLGQIVDEMIVSETDRDWLDDALISGDVKIEAVFDALVEASRALRRHAENGGAAAQPKAPVRRRR